jgi:diguanylate cyclase (GGDEF)-like protein
LDKSTDTAVGPTRGGRSATGTTAPVAQRNGSAPVPTIAPIPAPSGRRSESLTTGTQTQAADEPVVLTPAADPRLPRVRLVLGLSFSVLVFAVLLALVRTPADPLVVVEVVALAGVAGGLAIEQLVERRQHVSRATRDAGVTRMLQRLSRSLSFDSIVESISSDLRQAADVDHVAVARMRTADGALELTLVSASGDGSISRTVLSADALDPASAAPTGRPLANLLGAQRQDQLIANEIGRRVRGAYGLAQTLAAPLVVDERVVGAIVLSRRAGSDWTVAATRLLSFAAEELSAALSRAYRFEAAETKANIDALTGLPNRRYLEEFVAIAGPRRRAGDSFGVLMIDIDHFKRLNDRYGHTTGDEVLRSVGERISAAIRATDTPARYGGEEFAVVLRRANQTQALEVAERIRQLIGTIPPAEMGVREPVSVSVGVAVSESTEVGLHNLLESADQALYRAKREGRNRVVLAG